MDDFETRVAGILSRLAEELTARGWRMATAESCTGGWIAKCCTDLAGSSAWFDRGHIVYSYSAKEDLLGIAHDDLVKYGAVSEEIACQMARGARERSGCSVTVAATGIAGPGGSTPEKPIGLFYIGLSHKDGTSSRKHTFSGSREENKLHAAEAALSWVKEHLESLG